MSIEFENPEWHQRAACRTLPLDIFFMEGAGRNVRPEARRACASCPVLDQCYIHATTGGPDGLGEYHGFWAGTTPVERRKLAATRRRRAAPGAGGCGTVSGHGWHQRRGEPTCETCRTIRNTHRREIAAQRRDAAA